MTTRSSSGGGKPGALCVLLWIALASVASVASAESSESGEQRVRADLERFLRRGVGPGPVSIDYPPLAVFSLDRERHPGALRTELRSEAEPPFRGRVSVTVGLYAGDRLVARNVISPYVRVMERVVVPTRDLRRGDVLGEKDLSYAQRDGSRLQGDRLRKIEAAIGQRLRSGVRKGRTIRVSQIESVPVVDRGDRVTLVLQSGGLRIQGIGRAQEAGAVGEWIRVLNTDSRREVSGRLDAEGNAHVAF